MAFIGGIIVLFYILIAIFAPLLAPYNPFDIQLVNKLQPPSMEHWMGTDDKGRDILSRLLHGTRLSLLVGFSSVFIGALFGIILGIISGYYGGWFDTIIMRIIDIMLAFLVFYLLLPL